MATLQEALMATGSARNGTVTVQRRFWSNRVSCGHNYFIRGHIARYPNDTERYPNLYTVERAIGGLAHSYGWQAVKHLKRAS